jgi:hypothetical protein
MLKWGGKSKENPEEDRIQETENRRKKEGRMEWWKDGWRGRRQETAAFAEATAAR